MPSPRAAVSFVHLLLLWLLDIIEGRGFTQLLTVRLLRVAKQSVAHVFYLHCMQGHIVKLEMASTFTRILSNENMSPNSIELACAVRQPSPCVRAFCESGVLFHMSHLKLHFALHSLHSSHSTLHTSHSTLRTSHCTLPTPHFKLHTTLHTSQSTLHTSHFSLLSSHSTLHTSHSTLHTALFSFKNRKPIGEVGCCEIRDGEATDGLKGA